MATQTYNTGRVVGWSSYEEFLKQNPNIDPGVITEQVYQTMVTYGASRLVNLSLNKSAWSGTTILTQTVRVPGAIWGVTPIVGLDYGAYQTAGTVPDKGFIERAISNIFSCYVSNSRGVKAANVTSTTGYITFCAYPEVLELDAGSNKSIPLIVRGLGAEALADGNGYFGPEGLLFAGNGFGAKGASANYKRSLPESGSSKFVDMDAVIDMRTTDPKSYYQNQFPKAPVDIQVDAIQPLNSEAGIVSIYQKTNSVAPALYGTKLAGGEIGAKKIYPLDVVSPGTVKVFHDGDVDKINSFESTLPDNIGLFRDPVSYVIYETNQTKAGVPVANETYAPLFNSLRSEEILCPILAFQSNTGDTHDHININGNRRLYGYLNEQFLKDFALSNSELKTVLSSFSASQTGFKGPVYDNLLKALSDTRNKYKYLLYTSSPSSAAWYWDVIPIRADGYIDFISLYYCASVPSGWNSINSKPLIPLDNTGLSSLDDEFALMGSWWGGAYPHGLDHSLRPTFDESHPTTRTLIEDVLDSVQSLIQIKTDNRKMPAKVYKGKAYKSYIEMYKNTKLPQACSQLLHPLLQDKSIYDIVRTARLFQIQPNGSTDSLTPEYTEFNGGRIQGRGINFYVVPKTALKKATYKAKNLPTGVTYGVDVAKYTITNSYEVGEMIAKEDLTDSDQMIIFNKIPVSECVNFKTYLSQANADMSILVDIPKKYQVSNSPQGVLGEAGNNQTLALSVCKNDGSLCNLWGTDGTVDFTELTNGNLNWYTLVYAMYEGKSVDILGTLLKGIRNNLSGSGKNYLEFKSSDGKPIRLYVSRNTPKDSDIPDGSIGIGW